MEYLEKLSGFLVTEDFSNVVEGIYTAEVNKQSMSDGEISIGASFPTAFKITIADENAINILVGQKYWLVLTKNWDRAKISTITDGAFFYQKFMVDYPINSLNGVTTLTGSGMIKAMEVPIDNVELRKNIQKQFYAQDGVVKLDGYGYIPNNQPSGTVYQAYGITHTGLMKAIIQSSGLSYEDTRDISTHFLGDTPQRVPGEDVFIGGIRTYREVAEEMLVPLYAIMVETENDLVHDIKIGYIHDKKMINLNEYEMYYMDGVSKSGEAISGIDHLSMTVTTNDHIIYSATKKNDEGGYDKHNIDNPLYVAYMTSVGLVEIECAPDGLHNSVADTDVSPQSYDLYPSNVGTSGADGKIILEIENPLFRLGAARNQEAEGSRIIRYGCKLMDELFNPNCQANPIYPGQVEVCGSLQIDMLDSICVVDNNVKVQGPVGTRIIEFDGGIRQTITVPGIAGSTSQTAYNTGSSAAGMTDATARRLQENINRLSVVQNEVFQSVSNGKALIASAITDKGVSTENDATFQQMANNIASIQTGSGNGIVTVLSVASYKQIINTYSEVKKEA